VYVGIIADLVHLSAETLALSLAAAGERAVVVTDAADAAGLPPGEHTINGRTVVVRDGAVYLPNGTLTGASVGLDTCFRNAVSVGRSVEAAFHAVTGAPASALGRSDIGRLEVGGRADIVVLDEDLALVDVLVGGAPATA
jgi:N-acetylglucosamine-6-phosphate deacetylase